MKKIFFILIFPFSLMAQIQVTEQEDLIKFYTIGKFKYSDMSKGELKYAVHGTDTSVVLGYRNEKYQTINDQKSIIFKGGAKEVEQLYQLFQTFYNEANKDNKEFEQKIKLGKTDVLISKKKSFGMKCVFVWTEEGYFTMSMANVNELFSKK